MKHSTSLARLVFCILAAARVANGNEPHLAYAYPAGCQAGTEIEITVGGQHIKEATGIYLSGDGVDLEIVSWYRPMTRGESNQLQRRIRDTRDAIIKQREAMGIKQRPSNEEVIATAGITEEQLREQEISRQRDRDPKRQPNDQLAEEVTVRVKVATDAKLGKRELRFLTEEAISNPIWFHIGRYSEVRETEPNDQSPDRVVEYTPVVINGQIMPGDQDRFAFTAKKGEQIVIDAAVRECMPYLADAVPGWFQAVLKLTDSHGREMSFSDSFYYRQDPVLFFEVPKDDQYVVEIRDSIFRGREDFVYRITVGEIPFVTSIYPLGAQVDSQSMVQLKGWNLTNTDIPVKTMTRKKFRPVMWYTAPQSDGTEIRFPLQVDYWPETFDKEPNNDYQSAQVISTRTTINGRIDYPGDEDIYRVEGGGRLIAEVEARRLGSPLDSVLRVTDANGKEIGFNDDKVDLSQALQTHHSDSHLSVTIPATGNHYLHIKDASNHGGPDFGYRMRLSAPDGDFELRVTPATIIARRGETVPITVHALRKDGFDEDITLSLVDAPVPLRLDGNVIPGTVDKLNMTLTVPNNLKLVDEETGLPQKLFALEMEGSAGKRKGSQSRTQLTRLAVPAENMMQAFIWFHLVPVEQWNLVIREGRGRSAPFSVILPAPRLVLPAEGDTILGVVPIAKQIKASEIRVELSDPPPGLSASIIESPVGDNYGIKLTSDPAEIDKELKGNLIIRVYRELTPEPTEAVPIPKPKRTDLGILPAIPYEFSQRRSRR
ncbi:peptidase [Novipirellula aureliae]|nr:peptidase [Novipirellula aureliae]